MERLNSGEFLPLMTQIARLMRPKVYIELGVRKGTTFQALAPFAKSAVAVDKERGRIPETIRKAGLRNSAFYRMTTDQFAEFWAQKADPAIDLLLIDADHHAEQVLRDFDNFSPFVRPEKGLIILHDTLPAKEELLAPEYCCTAWEAAREIRTNRKYSGFEILTIPGNWVGLSLVRKSGKQLYWKREENVV